MFRFTLEYIVAQGILAPKVIIINRSFFFFFVRGFLKDDILLKLEISL